MGYSSLDETSSLSLDMIKTGKSFVDRLRSELESDTLIKHIIDAASARGITCVAEGSKVLANAMCSPSSGAMTSKAPCSPSLLALTTPRQFSGARHEPIDGTVGGDSAFVRAIRGATGFSPYCQKLMAQ